ncbi:MULTISPECIES: hypothetical protein [unclassified Ruminococcus]|uniref:hypothetical protein n=1 Tax=unclassified Ruminococcus TaxID=2608920 RepID=UPI00210A7ADF|nr:MULTISPECIES: hypothetical protein [unclassified Ruminococcus]MCQ4021793.1 hypothetical protein [Ruminococcus sp. zg-924]MCQ4114237.1 hypothetical protein [Ruminococcus sp. zg-921]
MTLFCQRHKKASEQSGLCYDVSKDYKKDFCAFYRCELNSHTRKRLVATASRSEGVYNRAGEPSVTFCGKE